MRRAPHSRLDSHGRHVYDSRGRTSDGSYSRSAANHPRRVANEQPRHHAFRRAASTRALERIDSRSSTTAHGAHHRRSSAQRPKPVDPDARPGARSRSTRARRPAQGDPSRSALIPEAEWPRDRGTARAWNFRRRTDPTFEGLCMAQLAAGRWTRAIVLRGARGPSPGANSDGRPPARTSACTRGDQWAMAVDRPRSGVEARALTH
jgi:hypothetical protein